MPNQAQIAAKQAAAKQNGLNKAQAAALQAGAPMEVVLAMSGDSDEDPDPDAEAEAEAEAAAEAAAAAAAAAQAKAGEVEGEGETGMTLEAAMARISELEAGETAAAATLAGVQAELVTAKAELATAQAEAKSMADTLKPYVSTMSVALSKGVDVEALSHTELVAKHSELRPAFTAAYKPGRQSKTAASVEKPEAKAIAPNILAAASNLKL